MKFFFLIQASLLFGCFLVPSIPGQEINTAVKEPKSISFPDPIYGDSVKQYGASGSVSVYVLIDKKGKVSVIGAFGPASHCSDLKSPTVAAIRNAAKDAAAKSVFEIPLKDGKPTEVNLHLTYRFRPAENEAKEDSAEIKPKFISGGVLNGRAKSFPAPKYPAEARANGDSGAVTVQVLVSEDGKVFTASAVSGHPLLREASVQAACKAKFSPSTLQGNPVQVSGVLTYNYVP